jgi:hypothetical protein
MNKIYCFVNGRNSFGCSVVALADDGRCVAGHLSSNIHFAIHDIGITSDWKHDIYKELFPDGYELEWIDEKDLDDHVGLQAACELNRLLPDE